MLKDRLNTGEHLEMRVERYQVDASHRMLDTELDTFEREFPRRLELRKYACVVSMARCVNGAVRAGARRLSVRELYCKRLVQLSRLRSWPKIREFLHRVADEMLELAKSEHRTSIERVVVQIRQDLQDTLETPSTLEKYAQAADVSRAYLSRVFTRLVGRSFREELRDSRMKQASKLLRETPLKISVIARHIGLQDASQFIADFRRHTGMTPAAYRRRHLD